MMLAEAPPRGDPVMAPPTGEERAHALDALLRHGLIALPKVDAAPYSSHARKLVAALKVEIGASIADPPAASAALSAAARVLLALAANARGALEKRRVKRGNPAFSRRVGRWRAATAVLNFLDFEVRDAVVALPTPADHAALVAKEDALRRAFAFYNPAASAAAAAPPPRAPPPPAPPVPVPAPQPPPPVFSDAQAASLRRALADHASATAADTAAAANADADCGRRASLVAEQDADYAASLAADRRKAEAAAAAEGDAEEEEEEEEAALAEMHRETPAERRRRLASAFELRFSSEDAASDDGAGAA